MFSIIVYNLNIRFYIKYENGKLGEISALELLYSKKYNNNKGYLYLIDQNIKLYEDELKDVDFMKMILDVKIKPVVHLILYVDSNPDDETNLLVKEYMYRYGINNVRGGKTYDICYIDNNNLLLLEQEFNNKRNQTKRKIE
jgi:hypothetical protein